MFFQVARNGRNQWYLYFLTIILCAGVNLIGSFPLIWFMQSQGVSVFELGNDTAQAFAGIENKNLLLMFVALPFVATFLTFWFCITALHKRTLKSVVTGARSFRWNRFFFAFFLAFIIMVVTTAVSYFYDPSAYEFQFNPRSFMILTVVSLIFLTIQSCTEELLFRGYLTQGVGLLTYRRLAALVVPATLFGALHLGNPEVVEHGVATMYPLYLIMGLSFGIMTLMSDGTELAMGYHAANNISISLLVTTPEAVLQTDSILKSVEVAKINEQYISLILIEIIILGIFAWKYNWKNWGDKLLGPIKR